MYISASIMTAPGSLENKLDLLASIRKDLIHVDFVDDYDLPHALQKIQDRDIGCDVHIISGQPTAVLEDLQNKGLINYPKFIFVQMEGLSREEQESALSFPNVFPAILIDRDWDNFKPDLFFHDAILLMTTTPGKSGGQFKEGVYDCIELLRTHNPSAKIYVDGGVSADNYGTLYSKGVHSVVIGSYLVKSVNFELSFNKLKSKLELDVQLASLADPIECLPCVKSCLLEHILSIMQNHRSNFVLTVDSKGHLEGLITDGDIKRQLMKLTETQPLKTVEIKPNFNFQKLLSNSTVADLFDSGLFERRFGVIPLADENGNVTSAINLSSVMD